MKYVIACLLAFLAGIWITSTCQATEVIQPNCDLTISVAQNNIESREGWTFEPLPRSFNQDSFILYYNTVPPISQQVDIVDVSYVFVGDSHQNFKTVGFFNEDGCYLAEIGMTDNRYQQLGGSY